MPLRSRVSCVALFLASLVILRADSLLPAERVSLDPLAAFKTAAPNWQVAGGIGGDPRHDKTLTPLPGTGVLVNNPRANAKDALTTAWSHGDIDFDLEYLIPPGSNSGVYLQGRYEVQILDSAGKSGPLKAGDNGGIYERWDDARGKGKEGYEGTPPRANASRAPGLWQHLHVEFRAARFDAAGKKTANARFVRVVLNGYTIHENVEVTGPTRGAFFPDEVGEKPLIIQGDHGSVALRHFEVKRYGVGEIGVRDLKLRFYAGNDRTLDRDPTGAPTREATPANFATAIQKADERGLAIFEGTIEVPVAGAYEFRADISAPARLSIDGNGVVYPAVNSPQAGTVALTAGKHSFKLEVQHNGSQSFRNGGLKVWAEGPGLAPRPLLASAEQASAKPADATPLIPVEPKERILLQRTFVPLDHSRRLYACFVGTPAGVHYAYDLEQAAIVGVWRGGFFEGHDLWHERAEDQEARPTGPGFTIEGRPLLFQFGDHDPRWPERAPPTSASQGYRLEANGQPVFLFTFSGVSVEDRIAPLPKGDGLTRTLKFSGKPREKDAWALLAEAPVITPQPGGAGWVVGDRDFYLDWPKDSPARPTLRREGDRMQLLVRVTATSPRELTYNLLW